MDKYRDCWRPAPEQMMNDAAYFARRAEQEAYLAAAAAATHPAAVAAHYQLSNAYLDRFDAQPALKQTRVT